MSDFIKALNHLPPEFAGAVMAIFMAFLRLVYDGKERTPLRIITEALLCGGLSVTATAAISAMGLNINWCVFVGGVIGYLGPTATRAWAIKLLRQKMGSDPGKK